MLQENSNTLTNMVEIHDLNKIFAGRPATPIWQKLYINTWPKSRQIYVYMTNSAKIYIFSTYMEVLQDSYPTGAKKTKKKNKVTGRFLVESSPRP